MCVCVCVCVCMCVCTCVCMCVCMLVCAWCVCLHGVCAWCVCMHVCVCNITRVPFWPPVKGTPVGEPFSNFME